MGAEEDREVTSQEDKAAHLFSHYSSLLGSLSARSETINWSRLGIQQHDLQHLDSELTEQEVHQAILDAPAEKAPGPDGFIGDLVRALHGIFQLRGRHWNLLNTANITLIPKRDDAETAQDYRPISLMHSVAKILAKVLANRLAPHLHSIISHSQSAFIKGRSIHDNFQYIQGAIRHFHRSKTLMLFIKLDIAKAFDNVRLDYLLEVLKQIGFGQRWRGIISLIWSTTSSRIILNGESGRPIQHRCGLRQGDPLSPMLFTQYNAFSRKQVNKGCYPQSAAIQFVTHKSDVENLQLLLEWFGEATGLKTNIQKLEIYKVNCEALNISNILDHFRGNIAEFPCKYLGLPLRIGRTSRADEQILIDKIGSKLSGWKGKLLTRAGRLQLVQAVLSAIPTYSMTNFTLSSWAVKRIDHLHRNFLWKGSEDAKGGHCLVNWKRVCRSKFLGGLGIKNLYSFNRALRLRWLWLKWRQPNKPWAGFQLNQSNVKKDLFRACTRIVVGNGRQACF
ncbi:hypothetical protein U9M48_017959 [Paspalum notatum var. saurae]|uniref:Reverse transcriptase domain-containing protein n=1 Tax=Paspalum notatum var. saurae TaxID=547442 RepID=A0AAQ3T9M6_PASNO